MQIVILLIVSTTLIFITGCSQTSGLKNYRVGTEGVTVEFSPSNPKSVYEQEEFGDGIILNNLGSYDVTADNPAQLTISYDTYRLFSTKGTSGNLILTNIHLQGKSQYYPLGEDFPYSVYFKSNSLTQLRESSTTEINYDLCYPYSTELTIMTCIDTQTTKRDVSIAACKSETYNGAQGQGAPIAITKIEPEIMLQQNYVRPQFKIYIENVGSGYVSSQARCDKTNNVNKDLVSGKVNVRAWLSQTELQCGPVEAGETLRLTDSTSFIRCFLPENSAGYSTAQKSYTTALTVNVSYTYQSIYKQDLEILRNEILTPNTTQGLCASYQVEDNGRCLSKCEYCAKNPGAALCQDSKPYPGFVFGSGFSCSCTLDICNQKLGTGSCIKGYCPGDLYCCSTNQCDQYQIEYKGKCVDKCAYCADKSHPSDLATCGNTDFTGFSCQAISSQTCDNYSSSGACVTGLCGGNNINSYCANPSKISVIIPTGSLINIQGNVIKDVSSEDKTKDAITQSGLNRCDYCSQDNTNNPLCKFTNNNIIGRVANTFSCVCGIDDANKLKNYQFVPDKSFCDNEKYCCDLTGLTLN